MSKISQRLKVLGAGLALAAGCLWGCSLQAPQPDPTNAAELLERYNALEDKDNYHATATMGITLEMFGMQMPVNVELTSDKASGGTHTESKVEMNVLGQDQTMNGTIYSEEVDGTIVTYTSTVSSDDEQAEVEWYTSTAETSPDFATSIANMKGYEDAKFEATEDGYVLTMAPEQMTNLTDSLNLDGVLSDLGKNIKLTPKDDSLYTITFDKTCHPTSAKLKASCDVSYDAGEESAINLGNLTMTIGMDMDIAFSGYGSVDAASVAVPADVKEKAVPADDISVLPTDLDVPGLDGTDDGAATDATQESSETDATQESTEAKEAA